VAPATDEAAAPHLNFSAGFPPVNIMISRRTL